MKGSISIFFACIMLCLITFSVSILDVSRINNFQIIASNNLLTASKIALSQYDPLLFNEYGLFAGEKGEHIEQVLDTALQGMYYPEKSQNNEFLLDDLEEAKKRENQSAPLNYYHPQSYEVDIKYYPFFYDGVDGIKKQMTDYMKIQLPFIAVEGIAEKFNLLSKGSKSSKWIEEKNLMIEKLGTISELKKELFHLTDGIILFDDGSYQISNEVNHMRSIRYQEELKVDYFPEEIKEIMEERSIDFDPLVNQVKEGMSETEEILWFLLNRDNYSISFDEEDVEAAGIGIEEFKEIHWILYADIEMDEMAFQKIKEMREEIQPFFLRLQDELLRINSIVDTYARAVEIMNEIEAATSTYLSEVESFEEQLNKDEECIPGLKGEIVDELETIKKDLIDENFVENHGVGDLSLMKSKIEDNYTTLLNAQVYGQLLSEELESFIIRRFISLYEQAHGEGGYSRVIDFDSLSFEEKVKEKQLQCLKASIQNELTTLGVSLYNNESTPQNVTKNDVYEIDRLFLLFTEQLLSYQNAIIFDYSGLGQRVESSEPYEEKNTTLLDLNLIQQLKENGLIQYFPELQMDKNKMPSHQVYVGATVANSNTNWLDNLQINVENIGDTFLINEYILGMFNNASQILNPNAKSISGYRLSDHFINYEVEYILGGSVDASENIKKVVQSIMGIRTAANSLHLVIDKEKRTLIYQIASAVSGWWGGGLATILFSVLLTGIWALMESMADVAMLLSGKSVPFIKTKGTWYTSLSGNIEELFNTAIQDAQNAGITLLGKVKEELTDAWKEVMKEMDGIYVEGMNEIMERMAVDISGQIEQNEVLLDRQFDEFIADCIEYIDCVNPFMEDSDEYRLAEDIRKEINNFEDTESKDNVRKSIDELFQLRIQEVLLASTEKLMNLVRLDMDVFKSMIKKEIEQGIDGTITQSTKIIEEKADEWKKTLFDEMDKEVSGKKTLLTQMISFDYKDYLRILLFSHGLSDEEKILRSMDLIQWNMQKNREDYELDIMNFFSGIDVRQKVAVDTWILPSLTQEGIHEQWYMECHEEVMY